MRSAVYRILDGLTDRLLPPRCLLCGGKGRQAGFDLCTDCAAELPANECACRRCGLPADGHAPADGVVACPQCADRVLPFQRCLAPLLYEFPVTRLIQGLKYEGALSHARVFGLLLAQHVSRLQAAQDVDLVVPMPLHPTRLVERGYNQSHEIARFAAHGLGLRLDPRALARSRRTDAQVGLDRTARRENVREAFVAEASRVRGQCIALLDDVVTTGSTVEAAAQALLDAGARRVVVWCVARALG